MPGKSYEILQVVKPAETSSIEKYKLWITVLASIAIPIVILILGKSIEKSIKERELAVKYVELSVGILSQVPTEENAQLREWALKNINTYAANKLDDAQKNILRNDPWPIQLSGPKNSIRNFSIPDDPRDVKYVILNDTATTSRDNTIRILSSENARGSYHYLVGLDGSVENIVPEQYVAWHTSSKAAEWNGTKNLNPISIGIGIVHISTTQGNNWTSLPNSHPAIGPDYPEQQTEALAALIADILKRHKLGIDSVLTAQQVAPNRRVSDLVDSNLRKLKGIVSQKL